MASAALAYKCMEVAYMRVVYSSHTSASRDRHELQTALQMAPLGNEFCYLIFTAFAWCNNFLSNSQFPFEFVLDILPNPISILMIWQLNVKYSDSFVEKISCLIHYNGLSEHHSSDKHSTCGLIMDTYPLWWLSVIWGGGGI